MALNIPQQLSITKIVKFDAAHFLPGYSGKCAKTHGHTWKVEIEVGLAENQSYNPDVDKMLLDFSKLKAIIKEQFLDKLDHCFINTDVEGIDYPSAENLALWIRGRIHIALPSFLNLVRVRVWESEDSYAEWKVR